MGCIVGESPGWNKPAPAGETLHGHTFLSSVAAGNRIFIIYAETLFVWESNNPSHLRTTLHSFDRFLTPQRAMFFLLAAFEYFELRHSITHATKRLVRYPAFPPSQTEAVAYPRHRPTPHPPRALKASQQHDDAERPPFEVG